MPNKYDFSGWATRNDLRCSDGRTIRRDAFKHCDGKTVPLVWNHSHNDAFNVIGNVKLENRNEGVYAYGTFNNTEQGNNAKELVAHGDVVSLSIYANQLKQNKGDVLHGQIREVSLVLAGANPGAYIDTVLVHGDGSDEESVIYTGEGIELYHADETVGDAIESLTEEQKDAVYAMVGLALEGGSGKNADLDDDDKAAIAAAFESMNDNQLKAALYLIGEAQNAEPEDEDDDEDVEHSEDFEGGQEMKYNVFEQDERNQNGVITHADQEAILEVAKSGTVGSFQEALKYYAEDNELQHDAIANGFSPVEPLFPEYKDVKPGAPELLTNDQGWISTVLGKVHKSPISRIRTGQVDIRNIDALRAKGYVKGKQKGLTGNFSLVRRTTDPQTVYVKNQLHRDDIIDITDFDYVQYLYNIDRMMLNEELAMAIMLGDGREEGDPDKISPEHIRPIWTDDELYTMHVDLDIEGAKAELQGTNTGANFGENYITAEAMVNTVLYAREKYKGSGTPDLYCTPHMVNVMLLARDLNGRRIYHTVSELAAALNVGSIITAEQFAGKTRSDGKGGTKELVAIISNLADYSLGATKGGQITHFTQFDIDFNQQKSLLETRVSGALTKVYSAIAIEKPAVATEVTE